VAGTTERVSTGSNGAQGNLLSLVPRISDDGRFVAFESGASNLVAADNNGALDIFTKDRASNLTYLDSTDASLHAANSNSDTPDLSGDGRYVSFDSTATNLVGDDNNGLQDLFVHAATRPTVTSVSPADLARGFSGTVTITGAGFRSGLVEADFGPGISVGSNGNHVVTWVNDNQLSANVSVSTNAPTGSHSVGVFNAGTGPGPGAGAGGDCLCANVH